MTGSTPQHTHPSLDRPAHAAHHAHHHIAPGTHNRTFLLVILLNIGFVIVEVVFGIIAHSTALIADAGHNLSDVLGLVLAWGANLLGQRRAEARYTWGLGGATILAALANAILLVAASGAIAWEAIARMTSTAPVAGLTVSIVAAVGVVINGLSAWLLLAGSKDDLNLRGAFLHMVADAAVSLGVVAAGIGIIMTQWYWLDPAISVVIVGAILWATWGLLRESVRLSMNAVPAGIDLDAVEDYLASLPGVTSVQDLHVWGISTTQSALTARLIMPDTPSSDQFLEDISLALRERFHIDHATLQVMRMRSASDCTLDA